MYRITRVLLGLCLLLISIQSQSGVRVHASGSVCPPDGCSAYLPVVQTQGKLLKIGLVTDTGGINDKSFNQSAWQAVLDAEANLGATGDYLESESQDDFSKNIDSYISQGYDLIITVGFLMGDATKAAAKTHPTMKFTIVDFTYTPILTNVISQSYASEQPAFLSGYLAAGMTKTGKVATFGGMNISTVTRFMDGFFQGVMYYNQENGTNIQILGWDPITKVGEFTNDFYNPVAGLFMGQKLLGQGADIIFPVAGKTGLGAAEAVQATANAWVIGVDTDWKLTASEYDSVILTSAIKNSRATTYGVINLAYRNSFIGGEYMGTLANQGVGLGSISSSVPQALLAKVEQVKAGIIAGTIPVSP